MTHTTAGPRGQNGASEDGAGARDVAALVVLDQLEALLQDDAVPTLDEVASAMEATGGLVSDLWDRDEIQSVRVRVLSALDTLLENAKPKAARSFLLERRARLLEHLGDLESAARSLADAYRELPSDEPLAALDSAAERSPRREQRVLDLVLKLAEDPRRRADAAKRRAILALDANDFDLAERHFHAVLEVDPDDVDAQSGLTRVETARADVVLREAQLRRHVASENATERAAACLALIELLGDGHEEVPALLETAFDATPADAELLRRVLTHRLGTGIETTGRDDARAVMALVRRHRAAAPGSSVGARAAGLALAESLPLHTDVDEATTREIGTFTADTLLDAAKAEPCDPALVSALDRVLTFLGRHQDLRDVLQAARRTTKSRSDEKTWLVREGEILWHALADMEEAEKLFRRVRAADPRDLTALAFFEADLTRREDWKRLHAVLAQKLAIIARERRVSVALEMAELAETRLQSPEMAVEAYKRVLTEEPAHELATERLLDLYRTTGKWHALIELLNGRIRRLGDGPESVEKKVQTLFQIIEIYQAPDKLPVEEMVVQTYSRIVQLSPTNVAALDSLAQRYEDTARWSELVQVLQKKIAATVDAEQLLDLFHQVADLYLSKMSSETQAVPFLERILELDPQNLEIVQKLRDIYKSKHNLERLYATYRAELELTDASRREPILTELALLATEKLNWPGEAITHWRALLDLSSKNEKAATALFQLYEQEGRHADLAALIESRLDHAKTKRRRVELLEKLGELYADHLGDGTRAKAAYREALEHQPGLPTARLSLQKILVAEKAWDDLKASYAENGDYAGYVAFLDAHQSTELDPQLRLDIRLEAVRVVEEHLGDPTKVTSRLELLLSEHPDSALVAEQLATRYEASGQVDRLLVALERLVQLALTDPDREAAIQRAIVALQRVGRDREVFVWALRLADTEIEHSRIGQEVRATERYAEAADAFPALIHWVERAEARVAGTVERCELLRYRARLLRERLRRPTDAIAALEAAVDLEPEDVATIVELENLTFAEQDWPAYERALQRRIDFLETEGDGDRLREALLRLAQLHEDILDTPDGAVSAYRRVLDRIPGDDDAVQGLIRLFEVEGRWDDLVELLDGERARSGDAATAATLDARAARILGTHLADYDQALSRLERSLEFAPGNDHALLYLWELFEAGTAVEGVIDLIEPILRRLSDGPRLRRVLISRLDREVDLTSIRRHHLEIATLSAIAEDAFPHRAAAFALDPTDPHVRASLEALVEALGRYDTLVGLYALVLAFETGRAPYDGVTRFVRVDDISVEVSLTSRLAELYEAQFSDTDRATACYERVLGLDPESLDTLSALERLHAQREDWQALLDVYRRKATLLFEIDEKRSVYMAMSSLLRDELGQPMDAIAVYESVLGLDERDLDAIMALEELYGEFGRFDDLASLLRRQIPFAENALARTELHLRLAALLRTHLGQPGQAIDAYTAVLADGARTEDAVRGLEAFLDIQDAVEPGQPESELALRAADVLGPRFRDTGEWQREVAVLTLRARLAPGDRERAGYLRTIAERHEHRGSDDAAAFDAYARSFRLFPDDAQSESGLARTATALGAFGPWADALAEAAPRAGAATTVRLLMTLGDLARLQLGDLGRAIDAFERVLELEPLHVLALDALDALYDATGRLRDRVATVERRTEASSDDRERRALQFLAGTLREALGDTDDAIAAYVAVLARDGAGSEAASQEALDRLLPLYEDAGAFEKFAALLRRKAAFLADFPATTEAEAEDGTGAADGLLAERRSVLLRLAEVEEVELADPATATATYEQLRVIDPKDRTAFENLRRLYGAVERWDDLEALLLEERANQEDERAANVLDYMLAQLYDNQLQRPLDAVDRYEAILARTPAFPAARRALAALIDEVPKRPLQAGATTRSPRRALAERAADVLENAFMASREDEAVARLLRTRIEHDVDDDAIPSRRRLAALLEQALGDANGAFDVLRDAAIESWSASSPLRSELVRLAAATERWDDLELVDREVLGHPGSPERRLEILHEMVRVAQVDRQDLDVAEGILRETLAEFPTDGETLESLRQLFELSGRTRDVVDMLRHEADQTADRAARIELLYRMAVLLGEKLGDMPSARDTYDQIIREAPRERRAYRALETILLAEGDARGVITMLDREFEVEADRQERIIIRERILGLSADAAYTEEQILAEIDRLASLDPQSAVCRAFLEAILDTADNRPRVHAQLARLYEQQADWSELIAHLLREKDEPTTDDTLRTLERVRTIQLVRLEDRLAAYETEKDMARAVAIDEGRPHAELRRRLDALDESASKTRPAGDPSRTPGHLDLAAFLLALSNEMPLAARPDEPKPDAVALDLALRAARLAEGSKPEKGGRGPRGPALAADSALVVQAFERALEINATCEPAIAGLRRVFQAEGRHADHVRIERHAIEHVVAEREQERAWLHVATLELEKLKDPVAAIASFEKVLELNPRSRDALSRLESIYREQGDMVALQALLERWTDLASESDSRAELDERNAVRYRLAEFHASVRSDRAAALDVAADILQARDGHSLTVKLVESILAGDGDGADVDARGAAIRARAAELLERVYTDSTPWRRWEAVYRAQLAAAPDTEVRMLLHSQLGQLYAERAADPAAALREHCAALLLDPGNSELEATVEGLAKSHGLWDGLAAAYASATGYGDVHDAPDLPLELATRYLRRLAEIARDGQHRPDLASTWLERLITVDPTDASALDALATWYERDGGDDLALLRVLKLRVDAATTDVDRIAELYRVADLERSARRDTSAATAAWLTILDLDPTEARAKDRLEAVYRELGDFEAIASILKRKLDFVGDPEERLDLLSELARIEERDLGRLEDAARTYRETLLLAPQNILALTSLERLCPRVGDHEGLLVVLETKRATFADPRARAEADFQIGALLFDKLDSPERALEAFRLVLTQVTGPGATVSTPFGAMSMWDATVRYLELLLEDPRVALDVSYVLEPIYLEGEKWKSLERTITVQLAQAVDPETRIELLRRLADIRDSELDDADGALDALGQAFALVPADEDLRATLEAVAERSERWQRLVDILNETLSQILAGSDSPELARDLEGWRARLAEERLGDLETATQAWQSVLSWDDLNPEALAALGRLYESAGRWQDRVDILGREIATKSSEDARPLRRRLADIRASQLQDAEGAFALYSELVYEESSGGNDGGASLDTAAEALDTLGELHPFLAEATARVLVPVYRAVGRWDDVVRLLLRTTAEATEETLVDHTDAFVQIGDLYDQKLGDPDMAYTYFKKALLLRPDRTDLIERVASSGERAAQYDDLTSVYLDLAGRVDGVDTRLDLLLRAGRLAAGALRRSDLAERCYREVLNTDRENEGALLALESLYEAQERWSDLADVCEAITLLPLEVGERIERFRKMALAVARTGDALRAEECWRDILALDDQNEEALVALEQTYREQKAYGALVDILDRRAGGLDDSEKVAALRVEIGRIRRDALGDPDGAIDAFEDALELHGGSQDAIDALEALYEAHGLVADLARVLGRRLALTDAPFERLALLARVALLAENDLDDRDLAVTHYESMLLIDGRNTVALDALIRIFEATERHDRLAAMLEQRSALSSDLREVVELLSRAAALHESPLGHLDRSRELTERILELDRTNLPALTRRAQLLERSGESEKAVEAYEALVRHLEVPADRIAAQLSLGRLYLYAVDNTTKALSLYRDILASRPDHPEAATRLKEVLYRRESWEALVPALEREVSRATDPKQAADAILELASVLADRMGDANAAFRWLEKGMELRRDHAGIVAAYVDQLLARGKKNDALPLLAWYTNWLEAKRKYPELAVAAQKLAVLHDERGEKEKAFAAYQVASQADSRNTDIQFGMGRLALETGRIEKALQTLQALLLVQHELESDEHRARLFITLARVCVESGDKAKAKKHLTRLLALDPKHSDGLALQKQLG
ncbi:MAG: hypothetical protein IV100_12015 [Myxococcales bacterium]|nr:hypothetical protein [Myxococcales bacterium]